MSRPRYGRRRRSPKCTRCVGKSRSSNHTTTQVSACPSPPPAVIISVSALLKLSQWCQRRLNDQSGEVVCASPTPLPPAYAPQQGSNQEVSGGSTASALGDAPGGESKASQSARGSSHLPAPPFAHEGGVS